jgi:hypothetical protein
MMHGPMNVKFKCPLGAKKKTVFIDTMMFFKPFRINKDMPLIHHMCLKIL